MKIKWLGHSCFLLTSESGIRILTDPFDAQVGYALPTVEADIVTTSHSHSDHNYIQAVKGRFKHLNEPGIYEQNGIIVTGVATFHDDVEGKKRGRNIVFVFEMDGLRICHLGDIGHVLTGQQLVMIGKIDIVMVPVGGTYTVNATEAFKTVKLLNPAVTIPMHFQTPVLGLPIDRVEKFLNEVGVSAHPEVFAHRQEIEVTQVNLKAFPGILVLDYK